MFLILNVISALEGTLKLKIYYAPVTIGALIFSALEGTLKLKIYYAPVTIGALIFAPVCLSVCLSVCHTLQYRVCVINSSHSFLRIFLKPCIPVVDKLKMCK